MRICRDRAADPVQIMAAVDADIDARLSGAVASRAPTDDPDENRLAIGENEWSTAIPLATIPSWSSGTQHEFRDMSLVCGDGVAIERLEVRLEKRGAKRRAFPLCCSTPSRDGDRDVRSERTFSRLGPVKPNSRDGPSLAAVGERIGHEMHQRNIVQMKIGIVTPVHDHAIDPIRHS